ncbi:CBS domain-containing protein [Desulforhopalus vacuolatus]|uniref:CBS and ACT domain-containing protein n=1 Tax=Desulforhopalus vacuolatus TaxID=40414 RepID=UPI001965168B|nr:CBS and ACT domain-containing protein [Desulforhopalus vacuolatus]MBM9520720.1 CBS domain-containing protein [Desulforhopalus vacuolatus]
MYIGRIMHRDLITVHPETSIAEAERLVKKKGIDHLPVVNSSNKLVGVISDRDIKSYSASPATTLSVHELTYLLEKLEVSELMSSPVITVPPETTIERAAYVMVEKHISSLPVVDGETLAGIITRTDVLKFLLRTIGLGEDSARMEIFVRDGIGQLARICSIFRDADINIMSLISCPEPEYKGITQLVLRVNKNDEEKALATLREKGIKAKGKYVTDITPWLPEE